MNFDGLKNYEFFISLGYVTIIASIITLIVTQIVKWILKKRHKINEEMDPTEKDMILAKTGRIVALLAYTSLYVGNEFYLKHSLVFDGAMLTGLLSGATMTLTIAKGLYTMIRQSQKKKTVFEKLKFAEETLHKLQEPLDDSVKSDQKRAEEIFSDITGEQNRQKWVLNKSSELDKGGK